MADFPLGMLAGPGERVPCLSHLYVHVACHSVGAPSDFSKLMPVICCCKTSHSKTCGLKQTPFLQLTTPRVSNSGRKSWWLCRSLPGSLMRMSLAVYSQAVQFLSVAAHMCLSPSCTLAQCCSHSIAGMARASERNRSTPKQNFLQPRLRLARYNFCHILLGESRYKGGQIQSLGKQTTLR